MSRRKKGSPPIYPSRPHGSGQARIVIGGKSIYLGTFGSTESYARYAEIVAQWATKSTDFAAASQKRITIGQLCNSYLDWAEAYYVKPSGRQTSEVKLSVITIRHITRLFGSEQAEEFGPLKLSLLCDEMVRIGWAINTINSHLARVKRIWRWGVSKELVEEGVHRKLLSVRGVSSGRSGAPTRAKKKPVALELVDKTLPGLTEPLQAIVWVQRLTGCRPGEACGIKPCDIVQEPGGCWVYRPSEWKTEHHEELEAREIWIGPKLQGILRPWLESCEAGEFLFKPRSFQCSKSGKSVCQIRRYTTSSYGASVRRACDRLGLERWHPNQLRHTFGTMVRSRTWGE